MPNHSGMWTNDRAREAKWRESDSLGEYTHTHTQWVCMLMCPVWGIKRAMIRSTSTFECVYMRATLFQKRCECVCRFLALCIKITIRKSQQVEDLNCNFHVQWPRLHWRLLPYSLFYFQLNQFEDLFCFFFLLCHWFVVVFGCFLAAARVNEIWIRVNSMRNDFGRGFVRATICTVLETRM